jgi:hypothetical protein
MRRMREVPRLRTAGVGLNEMAGEGGAQLAIAGRDDRQRAESGIIRRGWP